MIEDSLKQKEKQMNVLKNKHKTALMELLGAMPEKNFAMDVNKIECELRMEVDCLKKKLKENHTNVYIYLEFYKYFYYLTISVLINGFIILQNTLQHAIYCNILFRMQKL